MIVLVLNSGSSSIKFQAIEMKNEAVLISGLLEKIGQDGSRLKLKTAKATDNSQTSKEVRAPDHEQGLRLIVDAIVQSGTVKSLSEFKAVGHRVVHGGEEFHRPTLLNDSAIDAIRRMNRLAPLHNPANLSGIEVAQRLFPGVPQVAVFDTAFHHTMPEHAYRYAIPESLYRDQGVRRYGFHGTSHGYVAKQAAQALQRPLESTNLITLHLGNGASATAIRGGQCIDTSMGLTPLEGLVMGTRSGDLDPAIPFFLARALQKPFDEIEKTLNKESGLLGLAGVSDMRDVEGLAQAGNEKAKLALDLFAYRIKKYIGAYWAALGELDAVVFTGGIGENSSTVRAKCCEGLEKLGLLVDLEANSQHSTVISKSDSLIKIFVIPTNEELEIARQTLAVVH